MKANGEAEKATRMDLAVHNLRDVIEALRVDLEAMYRKLGPVSSVTAGVDKSAYEATGVPLIDEINIQACAIADITMDLRARTKAVEL